MADLDVQPKKKSTVWPWILGLLGVLVLVFLITRDRDDNDNMNTTAVNDDSAYYESTSSNAAAAAYGWDAVDFNAPRIRYDEVRAGEINIRGNDQYSIYGLGEDVLFDKGKATIRSKAEQNLQEIVNSIRQRHPESEVRIYGHTDATGSGAENEALSQQRVESVRNWLSKHGISAERLSVHAMGEGNPEASNNTAEGKQLNRRVEIVALNTK